MRRAHKDSIMNSYECGQGPVENVHEQSTQFFNNYPVINSLIMSYIIIQYVT